jgi:hypothetical protein
LVVGAVLVSLGVSVGAWIAVAGIVLLILFGLFAPWPLSPRWTIRKMRD